MGNVLYLLIIQFGVHRERQHFLHQLVGHWKIGLFVPLIPIGFLQVQGNGIIYPTRNTVGVQVLNQSIPLPV